LKGLDVVADAGLVGALVELLVVHAFRSPLWELHVELEPVTGLGLLVALPALAVRLALLIRWEPRHAVPRQHAVH
jgi:hypothetical protein